MGSFFVHANLVRFLLIISAMKFARTRPVTYPMVEVTAMRTRAVPIVRLDLWRLTVCMMVQSLPES